MAPSGRNTANSRVHIIAPFRRVGYLYTVPTMRHPPPRSRATCAKYPFSSYPGGFSDPLRRGLRQALPHDRLNLFWLPHTPHSVHEIRPAQLSAVKLPVSSPARRVLLAWTLNAPNMRGRSLRITPIPLSSRTGRAHESCFGCFLPQSSVYDVELRYDTGFFFPSR